MMIYIRKEVKLHLIPGDLLTVIDGALMVFKQAGPLREAPLALRKRIRRSRRTDAVVPIEPEDRRGWGTGRHFKMPAMDTVEKRRAASLDWVLDQPGMMPQEYYKHFNAYAAGTTVANIGNDLKHLWKQGLLARERVTNSKYRNKWRYYPADMKGLPAKAILYEDIT